MKQRLVCRQIIFVNMYSSLTFSARFLQCSRVPGYPINPKCGYTFLCLSVCPCLSLSLACGSLYLLLFPVKVWHGGSVVSSVPSVRRVAGSNPTLAATWGPFVQVLHSQLPVVLWHVNSDTVSMLELGHL